MAAGRATRYMEAMNLGRHRFALPLALSLAALSVATGAAFGAWVDNGAAIFMTLAQIGLSWCF